MIPYQFLVSAQPSARSAIPELPNFITFLHGIFHDTSWVAFLHQWQSIVFSIIIAAVILIFFHLGTRKKALIPCGFQNFLELSVDALRSMVLEVLGPQGDKFVPLLGTLFIYILT